MKKRIKRTGREVRAYARGYSAGRKKGKTDTSVVDLIKRWLGVK